jgi:cell division protein FtsI/penicillin-binding protein 2
MKGEKFWRYKLLGIAFALSGLAIIVQLVRIQVIPQAEIFREQRALYRGELRTVYPERGQIYDRWGHLLAGNTTVFEVGADLASVKNPDTIALAISAVTGADRGEIYDVVSQPASDEAVYVILANYVPPEQVAQLRELGSNIGAYLGDDQGGQPPSLAGLVYKPHLQRSYPERDLASNILGFVSQEKRGYFGVEERYNDLLAGQPRTIWLPQDPNEVDDLPEIPPGASLILTIDRQIQVSVEQILDRAVSDNDAESGTILVMDPQSGEILAMASTPRMDLNEYWRYNEIFQDNNSPFNAPVSKTYEPGSVFKVLTMAAALDHGAVKPDTPFLDTGVFEIGGIYINNWNLAAWGPQDMLGCLQHSLNVCLAWVASELGPGPFYEYMRSFGIGHSTGVDLAGEMPGRLKSPGDEDWFEADLGTNSFGQGLAVTPVQMVMAVSAIANNGNMVVPHVLRSMVNNGRQYDPPPQVAGTPIKRRTARTLSEMLAVSLESEASNALVTGYRVAGKTGTAEIPTPLGYTSAATNASFVGWGPVDDPQFLIYVWLEKPTSSPWGSVVAAPVFREVAERVVVYLNLPPDNIRMGLAQR